MFFFFFENTTMDEKTEVCTCAYTCACLHVMLYICVCVLVYTVEAKGLLVSR